MKFRELLEREMFQQKITRDRLAKKVYRDNSLVSKILRGDHRFNEDTLDAFMKALGLTFIVETRSGEQYKFKTLGG